MQHSLWCYHPRIGYTFMPSVKSRVPFETGGYLVRTNSSGFRSDREFVKERAPGTFRALLFGDSQTGGDGVANPQRFSDILETTLPGLEVFNFGLTGSGTDQQYLTWLEHKDLQHDLVIVALYVNNIARANSRYLLFHDANGKEVYYAKPYYVLENQELTLHHIPVPKRPWTNESFPPEEMPHVDRGGAHVLPAVHEIVKSAVPVSGVRTLLKRLGIREMMQKMTGFQPVPEYDHPNNPKWRLLRQILLKWIESSSVPVMIVPIPMWMFTEGMSDPRHYQARFRELAADSGCLVHDPLPDFLEYSAAERRDFRFKNDYHFSPLGHQVIAKCLAKPIESVMKREGSRKEPVQAFV